MIFFLLCFILFYSSPICWAVVYFIYIHKYLKLPTSEFSLCLLDLVYVKMNKLEGLTCMWFSVYHIGALDRTIKYAFGFRIYVFSIASRFMSFSFFYSDAYHVSCSTRSVLGCICWWSKIFRKRSTRMPSFALAHRSLAKSFSLLISFIATLYDMFEIESSIYLYFFFLQILQEFHIFLDFWLSWTPSLCG